MTIEQTVEIPANRRLTIDVPREVPEGTTRVIIQFPAPSAPKPAGIGKPNWRSLIGIDKGRDTMKAYFQRHWAENDREREEEREQYPEYFRDAPL